MPRKTPVKNVTAKRAKKTTESVYKASMKVFGKLYTATGSTVVEALEGLDDGHIPVKGIAVLTMKRGDRETVKIVPRMQLVNLFSPAPWRKEIGLKNVSSLFDL